MNIISNYSN